MHGADADDSDNGDWLGLPNEDRRASAAGLRVVRHGAVALAVALYVLACFLPAVRGFAAPYSGYECLTRWPFVRDYAGWWGNFAALAAALLLIAGWYRAAFLLGGVASCLALTVPFQWERGVLVGYFVWLTSFAVLVAGAGYCCMWKPVRASALTPDGPSQPPSW
jgi:hypothetical protein